MVEEWTDRPRAAPTRLISVDLVSVDSELGEHRKQTVTFPAGKGENHTPHDMTETTHTPRVRDGTTMTVIGSASDTAGMTGTTTTVQRDVRTTTGVIEVVRERMSGGRDGRVGRGLLGAGGMIIASAIETEIGRGIIVDSLMFWLLSNDMSLDIQ